MDLSFPHLSLHSPQTALQRKIICNAVRISLGQNYTRESPVQCWPMASRQPLWGKWPMQCCIDHAGTVYNIVPSMLSKRVWNNIVLDNYLCNVGPERTGTFSQEKNQYNVVLICLCQHCTRTLPVQCWPISHEQLCTGKECYPNRCGPTLRKGITSILLLHNWQKTFLIKRTYTMLWLPSW